MVETEKEIMENKILINDEHSLIGHLELNEFIILDSQATFISNITAKRLYIRDSHYIAIKDCIIDNVELINCQDCLISGNKIGKLNIDNKLPKFKGWFSKRRNRKFRDLYGSNNNMIVANTMFFDINIDSNTKVKII